MKLIRPEPNFTYNIRHTKGFKLLTRLGPGLSHLGGHKFRHEFQDFVSPMCTYGQDIERTTHFLFHSPNHHSARKTIFHKINQASRNISRQQFYSYKDSVSKSWNKQNFADVYNQIQFINRDIQLSLNQINRNDSIVSLLFYL